MPRACADGLKPDGTLDAGDERWRDWILELVALLRPAVGLGPLRVPPEPRREPSRGVRTAAKRARAGRWRDAARLALRAADEEPLDAPWSLLLAARSFLAAGAPGKALRALTRARRVGPETAARLWLECYALDASGRRRASRERAHRAMEFFPEPVFESLFGARAERENRREVVDAETLKVLDAAVARGRDLEWALASRAETLRREEYMRFEDAARDLTEAARLAPRRGWIHALLGRALNGVGDRIGAAYALDRAVSLAPRCGWIASWRGHFRMGGRWRGALSEMRRGYRIDPSYPFGQAWLGGALRRKGKLDEAERLLRSSLRILPEYEWTHYELHRVLWARGRFSEAARSLARSYERDPKFVWARPGDEAALCRALEELTRARRRLPEDPWIKGWHAKTLLGAGRTREALEVLGKVRPGEPPFLSGARGECAFVGGDLRRALEFFELAERAGGSAYCGPRGLTRLDLGDAHGAIKDLERACAAHAAWVSHLKGLARALGQLGRDAAALRALDRALSLDPTDAEALRWRGAARLLKGHGRAALADFEAALARRPDDPQALQGAQAARASLNSGSRS